jgi:ComF family protein
MPPLASSGRDFVGRALGALGALLAPPCCAACDAPLPARLVFCASCGSTHAASARVLPGDVRVHAAGVYRAPLSRAITRMKFEHRPDLAARLAVLFDGPLARIARDSDVVPVPLHPARLLERGFNQSALLARQLARRSGARFAPELLVRARDTAQQSRLTRSERSANVARAFVATRALGARPLTLVDDVITTGSTLSACAEALQRAGATSIQVVVLAAA